MAAGERRQIKEITAVKGLSALIIAFLYHPFTVGFTDNGRMPFDSIGVIRFLEQNGGIMVELFLMLSGYLSWVAYRDKITSAAVLFEQDKSKTQNSMWHGFCRFIRRRIIRIFPVMWVTLLMTVVLQLAHLKLYGSYFVIRGNSSSELLYHLTGFQMFWSGEAWNAPAWTLNKLLICWCIFFFITWCSRGDRAKSFVLFTIMIIFGMNFLVRRVPDGAIPFTDLASSRAFVSFFIGCDLALLKSAVTRKTIRNMCLVLLGVNAAFIAIMLIAGTDSFDYQPYFVTFPLIVYPLVIFAVQLLKPLSKILGTAPFQFAGRISFALYLCNFPLEILIFIIMDKTGSKISFASPWFFLINVVLQISVSTVVWYLVEVKATDRIKKRISL